jgi:two-component system, sensor histidine kinase YesM
MLDYEIHVTGDIWEFYVQKLILQPLVENAIYHGIKNRGSGKVTIEAETKNGELILTVIDDGVGMSDEKLDSLNEELGNDNSDSEKIGYGLFNVNKRIRLSYGEKYGITLRRNSASGISVEIIHPIISNLEG